MKASEKTILRFMDGQDKRFVIPVYQRPYSWKRENCAQLIKDLTDVYIRGYETHFFGSIVYVSQNDGECEEYTIIDGQQRITTVSLLLLAIMNRIRLNKDSDIQGINPIKIKNAYLVDEYADDGKKLKLKLVQNDDAAYDAILEGNSLIENTSVTANYNYLYSEVQKLSKEDLSGLYKAITKLMIVSISLDPQNGDDPQLIFESLNSTGLDLQSSDKVRNYVLMRMNSKAQERFYKKYWKPLEEGITAKELNKFIRFYLEVKNRVFVAEGRVYAEFKLFHQLSGLSIESLLQDMLEYADYYKIINNPSDSSQLYTETLKRINKLEVKTCVPLCMDLFKANKEGFLNLDELSDALKIIENYIVRREICDLPTNVLNKVFIQVGADVEKDIENKKQTYYQAFCKEIMKRTAKSRFPNNHDFEDKFYTYDLYNAKASIRKYILERLENYQNKEQIAVDEQLEKEQLTIEHVMPQTLTDEWKAELGSSWELIHTKYKDTIGNLTLTAYNSDYSNSAFKVKRDMKEKGFSFSKLALNQYIAQCDAWGEKEIRERASLLYNKAVEIWWMPSVASSADNVDEWFDWDEEFNSTKKLVTEIIIKGQRIKTTNVTDAFRKINEVLYSYDPTAYHGGEFSWAKECKDGMRRPFELSKNMYIETNKSNSEKIDCIKAIAEYMGLESNEIRFLLKEKNNI